MEIQTVRVGATCIQFWVDLITAQLKAVANMVRAYSYKLALQFLWDFSKFWRRKWVALTAPGSTWRCQQAQGRFCSLADISAGWCLFPSPLAPMQHQPEEGSAGLVLGRGGQWAAGSYCCCPKAWARPTWSCHWHLFLSVCWRPPGPRSKWKEPLPGSAFLRQRFWERLWL